MAEAKDPWAQFDTTVRRLTPDSLHTYEKLSEVPLPTGEFDPGGAWSQTWRLWGASSWQQDRGFLSIERKPGENEGFSLSVRRECIHRVQYANEVLEAEIECGSNVLATPRLWDLSFGVFDFVENREFAEAGYRQTARVEDGAILLDIGGKAVKRSVPDSWTCNWSLFEAVQRGAVSAGAGFPEFAYVEDLDKVKLGHRIHRREERRIPFGSGEVAVSHFVEIGRGILPIEYFVDGQGRLLLVLTGLKAWVLDPGARKVHENSVSWHVKRNGSFTQIEPQLKWKDR
ncbi:hypothetical protein HQ520_15215 [bacterium]|nr:hypothetical protein [bacterium]